MKKNKLRGHWLQRIENVVVDGMPDVHLTIPRQNELLQPLRGQFESNAKQIWLELKAPIRPKRKTTTLLKNQGLRRSQINWHLKAASLRLPVYTVIRDDHRQLYCVHCSMAAELNDIPLDDMLEFHAVRDWNALWNHLENAI